MTLRAIVPWAIGLGVIVALSVVFNEETQPHPDPIDPTPRDREASWRELGSTVALMHGRRYRACISVPWPASVAVTMGMIRARAEKEGFTDVRVDDERPSGWTDVECKQYVEATWAGEPRVLDLPGAIPAAWELVASDEVEIVV